MQTSKASVDVVLRQAGAADAAGLAAHAELTFRLAWSAFNRQQDMDDYCGEHFTPDAVAADLASKGVRVVSLSSCANHQASARPGPRPPASRQA